VTEGFSLFQDVGPGVLNVDDPSEIRLHYNVAAPLELEISGRARSGLKFLVPVDRKDFEEGVDNGEKECPVVSIYTLYDHFPHHSPYIIVAQRINDSIIAVSIPRRAARRIIRIMRKMVPDPDKEIKSIIDIGLLAGGVR